MTETKSPQTKLCNGCGIEKPVSEFSWKDKSKRYLRSQCKACCNAKAKEYREANREKVRESHKKWRKNHKEKYNTYQRKYYKKHKEEFKGYNKKYYDKNIERERARAIAYYEANKERIHKREKKRLQWIRRYKNLTREQQNKVFEENVGLVFHIVKKYYCEPDQYSDLIQEGYKGLWDGILRLNRYDPRKGALSTFLGEWIRGGISHWIYKAINKSGLSASQDYFRRARNKRNNDTLDNNSEEARLVASATSLDKPITHKDEEAGTLLDVIGVEDEEYSDLQERLLEFLKCLDERSFDCVCSYYGIGKEKEDRTSIGKRYGIGDRMVGVIIRQSLETLRDVPGMSSLAVYL